MTLFAALRFLSSLLCLAALSGASALPSNAAAGSEQSLTLVPVGTITGALTDVAISGTTAYLGTGNSLTVFDITTPNSPQLMSTTVFSGTVDAVAVEGTKVYVAYSYAVTLCCVAGVLAVFDIQNPRAPRLLGQASVFPTAQLCVVGQRAYLSVDPVRPYQARLTLVDVADAASPQSLGVYDAPETGGGGSSALAVKGTIVYVQSAAGLEIVDVSNPQLPTARGTVPGVQRAETIVVNGDIAYVADPNQGVLIFDVSTPDVPKRIGTVVTEGQPLGIDVQGDILYLTLDDGNVSMVRVADPSAPQILARYRATTPANGVIAEGSWVYLLTRNQGVQILLAASNRVALPIVYR